MAPVTRAKWVLAVVVVVVLFAWTVLDGWVRAGTILALDGFVVSEFVRALRRHRARRR